MKKELKIGIFAVVVLVVTFFVLNYLRGEDIFNREIELVSEYSQAEGLVASAPVYVKGYKAGKVMDVEYDTERDIFYVTCSVSKKFNIPSDSRMVIYSIDIMGGRGVRIEIGHQQSLAHDGDTLTSAVEYGLMDELSSGISPLLAKVNGAIDSLSVTVSGVNRLLSEANIANVSSTLANLDATMTGLRGISESVNGKSKEITDLIDNMSALSAGLQGVVQKVDTTMTGVRNVVYTLEQADIDGVVTSFKALLDNVNDPEGTVGRLMREDSIYNSVDTLLVEVNSLVEKIKENPKKYLKISVF